MKALATGKYCYFCVLKIILKAALKAMIISHILSSSGNNIRAETLFSTVKVEVVLKKKSTQMFLNSQFFDCSWTR